MNYEFGQVVWRGSRTLTYFVIEFRFMSEVLVNI